MAELKGRLGGQPSTELRVNGKVVGLTDKVYSIEGKTVRFDEILVRGDLTEGDLEYNGHHLRIVRVEAVIGLLVGAGGPPRGPVWRGVECEVVD